MKNYNTIAIDSVFKDSNAFEAIAKIAVANALKEFPAHATFSQVIEKFGECFDSAASKYLINNVLHLAIDSHGISTESHVTDYNSSDAQGVIGEISGREYLAKIDAMFEQIGKCEFIVAHQIYVELYLHSKNIQPKLSQDYFQNYILTIHQNEKPHNWEAIFNLALHAQNQQTHDDLQKTLATKPDKKKTKKV